jgi:heat shock protein HtpX
MVGIMVGSIVLISDFFLRSLIWGRGGRRKKTGGGQSGAILMVIALVFAILAPIFAKLLQLAVSRQREYLADATAARMTRYPEGLASALEKIAGDREVLEVANRATQHLYIVNPIKPFEKRAKGLFSTHPPIEERVARLRAM